MAITMKRQLDDEEKQIILKRHGKVCFATGHPIPDEEKIHFDHIKAHSLDGQSDLNNIAPMCEHHNMVKGMMPLEDFRIKLRLVDFFAKGERLTLRHLLEYLKGKGDLETYAQPVSAEIIGENINLSSHSFTSNYYIQQCPRTGWKYFYGNLPMDILNSDDDNDVDKEELQPRFLIFDKVFEMYQHFQTYPVLQPSIGRIINNKILLFDGQHKAAALLWGGRKYIECKIYINPDVKVLYQANIYAHDKLVQTGFFSSKMI